MTANAAKRTTDQPVRIIRDPEFARRLESACDGHPHVPPLHRGRLTWIRDHLVKNFNLDVSVETVRKWFAGEAKPRPDKTALLAQLLEVDVSWLQIGIDQDLAPRERKVRNAMADGAVNLIAGFIQMDGGNPAFPDEADKRAARDNVDLYAIIKGANYALHVALGTLEGGGFRFPVPVNHEHVVVLGVIRSGLRIDVIELTDDLIEKYGTRRGASIEVSLDRAAAVKAPRIESFAVRL